MKLHALLISACICAAPATAQVFDAPTTAALQTCFERIWSDDGGYGALPKAAITVFAGMSDETVTTVL